MIRAMKKGDYIIETKVGKKIPGFRWGSFED